MINIVKRKTGAALDGEGYYYFRDAELDKRPMIAASGDLGTDEIPIMIVGSDGTLTQGYEDGEALILTQANPWCKIPCAMHVRADKGLTTNAISVDIHGIG